MKLFEIWAKEDDLVHQLDRKLRGGPIPIEVIDSNNPDVIPGKYSITDLDPDGGYEPKITLIGDTTIPNVDLYSIKFNELG